MSENAIGKKGHLLYSPFTQLHFFRVYSDDKSSYKDYELCAEDIKVEILDNFVVLQDGADGQIGRLEFKPRKQS